MECLSAIAPTIAALGGVGIITASGTALAVIEWRGSLRERERDPEGWRRTQELRRIAQGANWRSWAALGGTALLICAAVIDGSGYVRGSLAAAAAFLIPQIALGKLDWDREKR